MQTIAKQATEIFCALIDGMNGKSHLKILNKPFMPLVIERLASGLKMGLHTAGLYSLCHYYTQNGDRMVDPEMCFIVVDNRTDEGSYDSTFIIPYIYRQDSLMIYEESIVIESTDIPEQFLERMQHKHTRFADQWLTNIHQQGFLKELQKGNIIQLSDEDEQ